MALAARAVPMECSQSPAIIRFMASTRSITDAVSTRFFTTSRPSITNAVSDRRDGLAEPVEAAIDELQDLGRQDLILLDVGGDLRSRCPCRC